MLTELCHGNRSGLRHRGQAGPICRALRERQRLVMPRWSPRPRLCEPAMPAPKAIRVCRLFFQEAVDLAANATEQ
jgi:hypothetical protein